MKTILEMLGLVAALGVRTAMVDPTPAPGAPVCNKVGVYDSRAVAYAYFWSPAVRAAREARLAEARQARKSGDEARAKEISAEVSKRSSRMHLQVFSAEPVDDILDGLGERLGSLQRTWGVDRLVSQWDHALQRVPDDRRVDVTDQLVRVFLEPNERQQRVLADMKTKPPIPLWKAKLMRAFGGM